jgi:hypothetical protein
MANNTIVLRGTKETQETAIASGTVYPGYLLEPTSTADTYKAHAVAGGGGAAVFAIEDELQGNDIDDAYATTKRMQIYFAKPGDVIYVKIVNGANIAIADKLVSNGNGYFKEHTKDSSATIVEQHVFGYAMDAVDMSGSSGVDPSGWCRMRVI